MHALLRSLFDTTGFVGRWYCGRWTDVHGVLHIAADIAIFGAYALIPLALVYFMHRQRQQRFLPIFGLFAAFILACGFGHLIDASIFWHPYYRLLTVSKLVTAAVSWGTVIALIRILPKAFEVERNERRFALAVRGSNDGVWDMDLQSHETFFSERFCELLGYTHAALPASQPWDALVFHEDREDFQAALHAHLERQQPFDVQVRLFDVRGTARWFRVRGQALWDRSGSPTRMAGSLTDINTDRIALLALDGMNAALDRRVQERTAELSAMLREREVLVREVHHRVKHNLQVVSSLINMQCSRLQENAGRAALRVCQARVLAIARVHELLYRANDTSRIPLPAYVRSLVAGLEDMGAAAPRIRIETHVDDVSLSVESGVPCGLILNELITNALKHGFHEERTGTVRISLLHTAHEQLTLKVEDDGVGLARDFDSERSASLGLSIVSRLANQLKGKLTIGAGPGASFTIVFPAPDLAVPQQERSFDALHVNLGATL